MGISSERFVAIKLLILYLNSSKFVEVDQLLKEYNGNLVVHNCLISADVDQGNLDKASKLFNEMRERNEILWTALISGFMKCGRVKEYMWASADLRNFGLRMSIWGLIVKVGFEHNCIGDIEIYKHVFNRMPEKSEISWTAMVQGLEKMVLERNLLFFLTKWRVDKGLRYFNSMEKSYGIRPNNRHYTCLVDMLSQPGCLPEAEKLIASMPCQPDSNTWAALLSGFSMHTSEKVAERTAKKLWEMAEEKSGGYVLLSNIYALAGRWVDVLKIRKLMKEKGLKKVADVAGLK
ncbi:pentatricopeptide repeat (PPR) superfamily protein [Actinidia rufa]|uniref:Pentatricopeptide repeat (PPR) superfamily protein n=1 Tax=Actinidia rufa TaxID=165716 RepID=A0A7J0EL71_9ERIC|nr:pentatricopeptide repeat (PPR) superfamily protein [Actinidia rufa]